MVEDAKLHHSLINALRNSLAGSFHSDREICTNRAMFCRIQTKLSSKSKFFGFTHGRVPTSWPRKSARSSLRQSELNPSTAANQNEISFREAANEDVKFLCKSRYFAQLIDESTPILAPEFPLDGLIPSFLSEVDCACPAPDQPFECQQAVLLDRRGADLDAANVTTVLAMLCNSLNLVSLLSFACSPRNSSTRIT
jgi:hypothetical protein